MNVIDLLNELQNYDKALSVWIHRHGHLYPITHITNNIIHISPVYGGTTIQVVDIQSILETYCPHTRLWGADGQVLIMIDRTCLGPLGVVIW
jgi:hypothetical protein